MKLGKTLTAAFASLAMILVGCENKKTFGSHDHDGDGEPSHGASSCPSPVQDDHNGDSKPILGAGARDNHQGHNHDAESQDEHEGDDHAEKVAGPNGGRVIKVVEPSAEFLVTQDKKVIITFLGENNQPLAVASQTVSIVCGDISKPTKLTLVKTDDSRAMISDGALPEGNRYPIIVTFRSSPDAVPVIAQFSLNLDECPNCHYKKYACICDPGHDD